MLSVRWEVQEAGVRITSDDVVHIQFIVPKSRGWSNPAVLIKHIPSTLSYAMTI